MKPTIYILVFFLFAFFNCYNQVSTKNHDLFENAKFYNYTFENGLPTDYCLKTCQATDKSIWIATMHGIAKFNGFNWEYFQQESSSEKNQIGSNWVMDIIPDNNKIWYHSDKDVGFINLKTSKTNQINTIDNGWGKLIPTQSNVFVSTWKGVYNYSIDGKPKKVTNDQFDECKYLININNSIYSFNTYSSGYFKYDAIKQLFKPVFELKQKNNKKQRFKFIHAQKFFSKIIALTNSKEVLLIDPKNESFSSLIPKDLLKNYSPIFILPYFFQYSSFLLVGTENDGLIVVNLKKKQITQCIPIAEIKDQTIASRTIHHIMRDSKNGVWISTDKGLSYFTPTNQVAKNLYFYQNSIIPENAIITALKKLNTNELIVGTKKNGAFIYNTLTNKTVKIHIPKTAIVNHIYQHNSSTYFITTTKSIYQFNIENKTIERLPLKAEKFVKVRKLRNNTIGISSEKGVVIFNIKNRKKLFKEQNRIDEYNNSSLYTVDFYKDNKGDLWILRKYDGLFKYNSQNKTYTKITPLKYGIDGIDFHSMSYNEISKKIVVSSSSGIFIHDLLKNGEMTFLNSKNGLEGDYINYAEIKNNKLYYTTIYGLYLFNMKNYKSAILHKFGQYENKENPIFELSNEEIYIPVSNYIIQYKFNFQKNETLDTPTLQSIIIAGKKNHNSLKKLVVDYSNRHLEFQFNSEYFINNNTNVLEYQLNNLQNSWTTIKNGALEFIGLEPNSYVLKVRWRNLTTNKTSKILRKEISISIPFYLSWWFYLILTGLITSIIYLLYRFQLKAKDKILTTRLQISSDLHDELGANVSSISIMSQLISETISIKSPEYNYLQLLKENTNTINETVNDIIWNVNPRFDKINDIVLRIKRFASPLFESAGIEINYSIQLINENIIISQDLKYNLYLLIKESINNCAKYSKATKATITFIDNGKDFFFELIDNGIGFDLILKKEQGNGISNMISRSKAMNAKLEIDTAPTKGTKIKLKLK